VKPQEAAEMATEAVRALNHAARTGGYQWPTDVYAVAVELTLLVRGLPTALGRTAAWLDAEHDAGRLDCDDGQNLTLTVHAAVMSLHDAARHTRPLLRALNAAATHTSHLTRRTP
jgi:hypothetical protein